MDDDLTPEAEAAHWEMSCRLAVTVTVTGIVLLAAAALAPVLLDGSRLWGLPLGSLIAGAGVPVLVLFVIFAFDGRQGMIDERYRASED